MLLTSLNPMLNFKITSDYGHFNVGSLYIGWNNNEFSLQGYPNEQFGLSFARLYLGVYNNDICVGLLNQFGCLN